MGWGRVEEKWRQNQRKGRDRLDCGVVGDQVAKGVCPEYLVGNKY